MKNDLKFWIWLSSLTNIPVAKRKQILDFYEAPENLWKVEYKALAANPLINKKYVEIILDQKRRDECSYIHEKLLKSNVKILTIHDERYPRLLKDIYDPPLVLYCKGKMKKTEPCIAIVGSRRATSYGVDTATKLAYEISKYGIAVVSGMARGIDTAAHKGALRGQGRTIAVLGCGIDIVYPQENKKLMSEIIEDGAVISEYLPGVAPLAYNFPARNRIISGLSRGVVVVEANEGSGSLITADFAMEQGREVFAVPGNIDRPNSWGTNRLIKEGAAVILDTRDILEELNLFIHVQSLNEAYNEDNTISNALTNSKILLEGLENNERKVAIKLLHGTMHIEKISVECNIDASELAALLIVMELKGIVERLPGEKYKLRQVL